MQPGPVQSASVLQTTVPCGIHNLSVTHWPALAAVAPLQIPLQQSLEVLQEPPFGMHIGVVVDVEVVLVDVEVVGVVVEVLVEVVLVVLVVVGAAVVVVVGLSSHGPGWSPWPRWPLTALWGPPWSSPQACQLYGRWLPSLVELGPERGSAQRWHCQQRA